MARKRDDGEHLRKGVRSDRSGRSAVHKPSALEKEE
ncbi:hypothetical protein SUDANB150_00631 [Streptomyces sp. enrichment culture]